MCLSCFRYKGMSTFYNEFELPVYQTWCLIPGQKVRLRKTASKALVPVIKTVQPVLKRRNEHPAARSRRTSKCRTYRWNYRHCINTIQWGMYCWLRSAEKFIGSPSSTWEWWTLANAGAYMETQRTHWNTQRMLGHWSFSIQFHTSTQRRLRYKWSRKYEWFTDIQDGGQRKMVGWGGEGGCIHRVRR